ncbi:Mariner Mos1 transposase [Eumeta japonica]|uniref:Mariner Mos1 transposase n=1 Tax=Eumeta variegata TaxID=151549 RepID=A0A4C1TEA7_EUMVA|nr:Mariner Mos1 transposase [Eumeta japonica]
MITGNEKLITYDKKVQKRSWSKGKQPPQTIAKHGSTRDKLMLCVCWDWKDIIHYKLMLSKKTIDSELYCHQLMRFEQQVEKEVPELINRKDVVIHHDNARSLRKY